MLTFAEFLTLVRTKVDPEKGDDSTVRTCYDRGFSVRETIDYVVGLCPI